jgi:hypothetical protein
METDKIALGLAILAFLVAVGTYTTINDYKRASDIRLNTLELNSAPISSLNPRLTDLDNKIYENKKLADDTINHCGVFENKVIGGNSLSCRQYCKGWTSSGAKGICLFAQSEVSRTLLWTSSPTWMPTWSPTNPAGVGGTLIGCDTGSSEEGSKTYCVCC